jgi:hypothetical protein
MNARHHQWQLHMNVLRCLLLAGSKVCIHRLGQAPLARAASWKADTQLNESVECELMQYRLSCVCGHQHLCLACGGTGSSR